MTLAPRLVVCLDVDGGRVVKGVGFRDLKDAGDPVELATRYERDGADEIVFLDISASVDRRDLVLDTVRKTASALFIPLTVGGGIRRLDDVHRAVRAGADKVAMNTAAVERPALLTEAACTYGAQCVVASIDAARDDDRWLVCVRGGRERTTRDAIEWAQECADRGAGEILLTSVDRDGTRAGYDLELTAAVAHAVSVPVIASGGAGTADHVVAALTVGGADAALVAGIVHGATTTIQDIRTRLLSAGVPVRKVS